MAWCAALDSSAEDRASLSRLILDMGRCGSAQQTDTGDGEFVRAADERDMCSRVAGRKTMD